MQAIDLSGQRFGRWTVLNRASGRQSYWNCVCDCGTERQVFLGALRSGKSQSCGCLKSQQVAARSLKHGFAPGGRVTPTYRAWQSMLAACVNPNQPRYRSYGAKGIRVDGRWQSFDAFLADMGTKPEEASLDRRDRSADFSPENCYWRPKTEKRPRSDRSRKITFHGRTQSMNEWAKELGIRPGLIKLRIQRGMPMEKVLAPRMREERRRSSPPSLVLPFPRDEDGHEST